MWSTPRSQAALLGTIPRANRGIIFIDEINRLADTSPELTDVLLDTMGTKPGRVQIEEAGLPGGVAPAGDGRGGSTRMKTPARLRMFASAIDRSIYRLKWGGPRTRNDSQDLGVRRLDAPRTEPAIPTSGCWPGRMAAAALLAPRVLFPDEMVELLATIYVDFDIESIRAMEAARTAARCRAALAGRSRAAIEDLRAVLAMALRHRVEVAALANILRYVDAMQEKSVHGRSVGAIMPGCGGMPGRDDLQGMESMRQGRDGRPDRMDRDCLRDRGPSGDGGGDDMDDGSAHVGTGLRSVLQRLFEHVRSEQHGGSRGRECAGPRGPQGAGDPDANPAGGPDGGYAGGVGAGAGARMNSGRAPESTVSEVCPSSIARPITQVGPKVVFAEEDLV